MRYEWLFLFIYYSHVYLCIIFTYIYTVLTTRTPADYKKMFIQNEYKNFKKEKTTATCTIASLNEKLH